MNNNSSLAISFLGPDGSGKSTIIEELKKQSLPFKNIEYFHLKPIKKETSKQQVVTNPHQHPPYSKLKSYIKLLYFIYQYNLGWIKNIVPLKKRTTLIIFDRYFDDLIVDNKRYRYGGSISIAKFVRFFIPKPDIYFILTTDAKVIYDRKKEVPLDELKRQIKGYQSLKDSKKYYNIDVNRSPEEIVNEIKDIILERLNG